MLAGITFVWFSVWGLCTWALLGFHPFWRRGRAL
jgi:hypothetical protein